MRPPFAQNLDTNNRWVVLANAIPWDSLTAIYTRQLNNKVKGADSINPRVVIGALIIKHMCSLSDRETISTIQENIYMQYFIGYSSFSNEAPFDPSLFVGIRKRLGAEQINEINEKILKLNQVLPGDTQKSAPPETKNDDGVPPSGDDHTRGSQPSREPLPGEGDIANEGELIVDATACPQDIAYPTDLNLLNDGREKSEELIDFLCSLIKDIPKPRTYREIARKQYLKVAQKKNKTRKEIRAANKKQLACLHRNIKHIYALLAHFERIPFDNGQYKYFLVIQTLYDQQYEMHRKRTHSIEDRIVSIHQPHVRPIVRGKANQGC